MYNKGMWVWIIYMCIYIYTCQNDQAWKWMFFPLHDQFSGTPTAWPWRFATWDNHVPPVFYPMTICFTCGSIPTTLHLNLFSAMIFLRFIWVHLRSFFISFHSFSWFSSSVYPCCSTRATATWTWTFWTRKAAAMAIFGNMFLLSGDMDSK